MLIDLYTNSKKHEAAIRQLPTKTERIIYTYKYLGRPMVQPMLDLDNCNVFYYPKAGPFVFREFNGKSCKNGKIGDAIRQAKDIIAEITKFYNQYELDT